MQFHCRKIQIQGKALKTCQTLAFGRGGISIEVCVFFVCILSVFKFRHIEFFNSESFMITLELCNIAFSREVSMVNID